MQLSHPTTTGRRRGNILIVTLLLLALFATVGLTIVYYTKDLSEQQRINIEAQSNGVLTFSDDGSMTFNQFLSNLIYDAPLPTAAQFPPNPPPSYLWGTSLMRTMYGGAGGGPYPAVTTVPWNGVGTFHEPVAAVGGLDRALLVNYGMAFQMGASSAMPEISNSGAYVPKNAPYTYPDLKDFYLASWVPATGEVLMPSYYRPVAFRGSNQAAGTTGLEPSNINWTNVAGMYLTARPRPWDNGGAASTFPYPPPNADGTVTGDVQNITGSYYFNGQQFVAHNDAIWVDIGMSPMTLLNGKTVKPLVAATIVDLDSVLNYNIHGNVYSTLTTGSGIGLGPWEINLYRALSAPGYATADGPLTASNLINGRPTGTASGITTRAFNKYLTLSSPTQQMPSYAAVPWNTGSGAGPVNLSLLGNGPYATYPLYSPTATAPLMSGYDSTNSVVNSPAMLYNPSEWPANYTKSSAPNSNSYPVSDLQSLMSQYSSTPYSYASITANPPGLLSLNGIGSNTIRGQQGNSSAIVPAGQYPFLFPPNPQLSSQTSNYRLDPANNIRGILTPYSWSLDMPGLSPNFYNLPGGNGLAYNPGTISTGGVFASTITACPSPSAVTQPSDFSTGFWNNGRAGLGPVDLNRPLADYRPNPALPLSPSNIWPANVPFGANNTLTTQAAIDRQQFAMSIFVRLVVASGADASYQVIPTVGESIFFPSGPPAVNTPAFNALRALAQIAANIVDYIDSDDVSTAFVWNPLNPSDPLNPMNFASLAAMSNSVVFGVEKTRVVINEAFAEVTNNPTDPALANPLPGQFKKGQTLVPATLPPFVRFWFELTNPSTMNATNTPIGTGTVPTNGGVTLRYPGSFSPYIVQIARSTNYTGPNGTLLTGLSGLLRDPSNPNNPGNVTGGFINAFPDLTWDFSAGDAQGANYTLPATPAGVAASPASYLLCGPAPTWQGVNQNGTQLTNQILVNEGAPDWNPTGGLPTWSTTFPWMPQTNVITGFQANQGTGTQSLTYNNPNLPLASAVGGNGLLSPIGGLNENIILLRRLANPYLPPNDPTNSVPGVVFNPALPVNPYITVDFMDYVPAADQVLILNGQRRQRTMGTEGPNQYPGNGVAAAGQPPGLASIGKVQPYAGSTAVPIPPLPNTASGTYTTQFTFPISQVVAQKVTLTLQNANGQTPNEPAGRYGTPAINHTFGMANSMTVSLANQTPTTPANGTYVPSITPPGNGIAVLSPTGVAQAAAAPQETLMTPFDWFPHMDRQLVNQSELLSVSTGKPHEYTLRSIVPNQLVNATDVVKFGTTLGYVLGPNNTFSGVPVSNNTLYRALDVLRIQPYGHMTALGGRVPGRLNINTIQDKRVWDSLFDAQGWNTFQQQPDVLNLWNQLIGTTGTIGSRTPSTLPAKRFAIPGPRYTTGMAQLTDTSGVPYITPIPGQSVYDTPTGVGDQPFLPFGAPTFSGGTFAFTGGSGINNTLARTVAGATIPSIFGGTASGFSNSGVIPAAPTPPYIVNPTTNSLSPHPYVQVEALRKIMNSTTTVSHTFAVWATIGYFDYNMTATGQAPILGAEYYNYVPGDLRRKYFSVVDRSMVGLDPGTRTLSPNLPFFTTLNGTGVTPAKSTLIPITTSVTGTGQVNAGPATGSPTGITTYIQNQTTGTNWIAIGSGATQEYVQAIGPAPAASQTIAGATVMTLSQPLNYPHWPGESVSNIIPGNPGPAANWPATVPPFYYSTPPHSYVVPFTVRLQ